MNRLLEMAWTNSLLAIGLAAVAGLLCLRIQRPAVRHAIWLVVLLKLVTPPLISIPIAVSNPFELRSGELAAVEPVLFERERRTEFPMDEESETETFQALAAERTALSRALSEALADQKAELPKTQGLASSGSRLWESLIPGSALFTILLAAWLGGACLRVGLALVRVYRFHRLLEFGKPAAIDLQAEADRLARKLNIEPNVTLWVVPACISPLLWAVGSSIRIVLPTLLLDRLGREQQLALIAHELAHLRRRDHWVRWLELGVTSLFWWHPVSWLACRQLREAEEQCCDSLVVRLLPGVERAYARAIVNTVEFLDARLPLPAVASGLGHVNSLKRRLTMIARHPAQPAASRWGQLLALGLGLLVLPTVPHLLRADGEPADSVAVAADNEKGDSKSDSRVREVERRLRSLEERLERMLKAMESQQKVRAKDVQRAEEIARQQVEAARKAEAVAKQTLAKRLKATPLEAQKLAQLAEAQDGLKKELAKAEAAAKEKRDKKQHESDQAKEAFDKAMVIAQKLARTQADEARKLAAAAREKALANARNRTQESVGEELRKKIEKQVEEIVKRTADPEKIKQLEKEIQDTVKQNLDPARLKQLDSQVKELVDKQLDPKRMQQLAADIQKLVDKSLAQQKSLQRHYQAGENAAKRALALKATRVTADSGSLGSAQNQEELQRRIERLEKKLDRVLEVLESRKQ